MHMILPRRLDTDRGTGQTEADHCASKGGGARPEGTMAGKKARKRADGSYSNAWRNFSKIILRPGIRLMMRLDWQRPGRTSRPTAR